MIILLSKAIRTYTFHRAITAILLFLSVLFAARTIDQSVYAQILQMMFLGKFLLIGNLGATSGFFVSHYGHTGMLKAYNTNAELQYCLMLFIQLCIFFLPAAIISAYIAPDYTLGIVMFVLLIPAYVIEPPSRLRRKFYISLAPDLLMSVSLLSTLIIVLTTNAHHFLNTPSIYVGVVLTFSLIFYSALVRLLGGFRFFYNGFLNLHLKDYLRTVALGMPVYLGTALFMLASGLDRLLMPLHIGTEEQAVYFLSYQLATGAMIFLASANFVNTIDLGEAFKFGSNSFILELRRKLRISITLAAASNLLLLSASFVLSRYFLPEFRNLVSVVMILTFGLSAFFVAGSITPILAYLRKQLVLTIAMGLAASLVLLNNLIAIQRGLGILWLSSVTSIVLVVYSLFAIIYTISVVRNA